jgi:hypothetical protein
VNLFFYDGMYWVYERDNWYASTWYNGPWGLVGPEIVPVFVLRVPVLYYRHPPVAWIGWGREAPPRWGERWGHDWERRRGGWDRWDRHERHVVAPLPVYQRQYSGNRYPQVERQQALQREKYRYQPRDPVVRQVQEQRAQPQQGNRRPQDNKGNQVEQRPNPRPQPNSPAVLRSPAPAVGATPAPVPRAAPAVQRERPQAQPADRRQQDERRQQDRNGQRSKAPAPAPQAVPAVEQKARAPQPVPAVQEKQPPPRPAPVRQERSAPKSDDRRDGKGEAQEQGRGQEKGQERGQEQERGQGRNK